MNQRIDFFGLEEHIAAEEARLADASGEPWLDAAVTLAWYLRERDESRSRSLAAQARAFMAAPAAADEPQRTRLRARLDLTQSCYSAPLDEDPAVASGLRTIARQGFEAVGDARGIADCWFVESKSNVSPSESKPRMLQAGIEACERAGDAVRLALLQCEAAADAFMRNPTLEMPRWEPALSAADRLGHAGIDGAAAFARGFLHAALGGVGQSIAQFAHAHACMVASGRLVEAVYAAGNASAGAIELGDYVQAVAWGERALQLARGLGRPKAMTMALVRCGDAARRLGRSKTAAEMLREAVASCEGRPPTQTSAIASRALGEVLLESDEVEEALHWLDKAVEHARSTTNVPLRQDAQRVQAEALSRLGRVDEAVEAIEYVLAQVVLVDVRVKTMRGMAAIARRHGLPTPAGSRAASAPLHHLQAAIDAARASPDYVAMPELLSELSREYEAVGDIASALDHERRAVAAREQMQSRKVTDMATEMQVRYETERVHAEAAHHKALAEAEARRADAEARANRAKSAFLANMSHELRSPLNAMLGFTRLRLRDAPAGQQHEELSIILRSGEHLYTLINQVLEMSKIEAGRMELVEVEFDLHALLEELREMFVPAARAKALRLGVRCDAAVPRHVRGDLVKLRQVLTNMLSNAVKFTPAGDVELRVQVQKQLLEFEVIDTGVGIAADELSRLGQAFVQARAGQLSAEGTGLGLAISRGFVQLMGGELVLSSTPGQGTRARFALPLYSVEGVVRDPPAGQLRRVRGLAPGIAAPRILVVDDRDDGRLLLARTLEPLGFQVRQAADGKQAIAAWQQWAPQLILMDMRMPVMDGLEATRRIKAVEQGRATVVVALTASSFDDQREEILAAGCDDFMRKPFQEDALLAMLAMHLELEYAYEEPMTSRPAEPDAQRLASLPQALRERLLAALERLDVQAVEVAMGELREVDAPTADTLAPLARQFEYPRMSALLGSAACRVPDGDPC